MKLGKLISQSGRIAAITLITGAVASLAFLAFTSPAVGQTGTVTKTITLGTNGQVLLPSNFWQTNAPANAGSLSNNFAPLTGSTNTRTVGAITNGTWNGTTIALTNGGTGATNPAGARTNLGLGTAATSNSSAFATTAQGALADTALQPASTNTISNKTISGSSNTLTNIPAGNLSGSISTNNLPVLTVNFSGLLHNSPMTMTNGQGTATLANQSANTFLAGPTSGTNAAPTMRAIVAADLPTSTTNSIGGVALATDAEIQTGTDTAKAVRSSGLAAWWTWVKTQAQTFAGNVGINGNTTLGDASGDAVTINAGTISAPNATSVGANDVANVGTLDGRYMSTVSFQLAADTNYTSNATPADLTGFSTTVVSGGTYQIEVQYFASVASGGSSAGGLKFIVSGPSVSAGFGTRTYGPNNGAPLSFGLVGTAVLPDMSNPANAFTDGNWTGGILRVERCTVTFSAGGTLKIQASQNSSSGTATKLWGAYTAWNVRRIK